MAAYFFDSSTIAKRFIKELNRAANDEGLTVENPNNH